MSRVDSGVRGASAPESSCRRSGAMSASTLCGAGATGETVSADRMARGAGTDARKRIDGAGGFSRPVRSGMFSGTATGDARSAARMSNVATLSFSTRPTATPLLKKSDASAAPVDRTSAATIPPPSDAPGAR